jgi:regulator of cell morphogenesis and NO signaling
MTGVIPAIRAANYRVEGIGFKGVQLMSLQFDSSTTVGDIVAADYRAASVFDRYGIDFCCGGKRTFSDACTARRMDPGEVATELAKLSTTSAAGVPDASWPVADLTAYIVERHHEYVRAQLPVIGGHLDKLVAVHGDRHPELIQVAAHFEQLASELRSHMMKEEHVLFPYLQQLAASAEFGLETPMGRFGSVSNPIRMMEAEHRLAGDELAVIREMTSNYAVPSDGCTTYRVCYEELAAFDADLRQHIHLENNILFPHAVALEAALQEG